MVQEARMTTSVSFEQAEECIKDFFADQSRSQAETKRSLNALSDICLMLAETLDASADADQDDKDNSCVLDKRWTDPV